MNRTTRQAITATFLVLPLALAGCGKDSPKVSKAAFCKTNAEVDAATANLTSEDQAISVFTKILPKIDRALDEAPDAIKPDVRAMVDAIHHGVDTKDLSVIQGTSLDAANARVEQFCA